MEMNTELNSGDWIVHTNYGVGQVIGEDTKALGGDVREYYKVQTRSAVYWLPKDGLQTGTVRSLASEGKFDQALSVLDEEPEIMNKDYKKRRVHINEVFSTNSVVEFARLIRDLYARARIKTLNDNEKRALEILKERFAREWALSVKMEEFEALTRLERILADLPSAT